MLQVSYIAPKWSRWNDFILLNKSASRAKNPGEQTRAFMTLLFVYFKKVKKREIKKIFSYPSYPT